MSLWQKFADFFNPNNSQSIKTNDARVNGAPADPMSDFSQVLDSQNIVVDLNLANRNEVLKYLANLIKEKSPDVDSEALYGEFLVRETIAATNLGDGVAVPHIQDKSVSKLTMLILKLDHPVKWTTDVSVNLIIALVSPDPEKNYQHVPYLSSISRLLLKKGFLNSLNKATTNEQISRLFL